ncbi:tetratricopeptide repeat protein [bacterium]
MIIQKIRLVVFSLCIILGSSSMLFSGLKEDKEELLSQVDYIEEDAVDPVLISLYVNGLDSYNANEFKDAAFYFNKILELNRNYKNAEFLAQSMAKMMQYPVYEARDIVILEYYERGKDFYSKGQYLKSLNVWEKLLDLSPEQADVIRASIRDARKLIADPYYERGWKYYKAGKFEQAIEEWERVLALDPAYHGLASLMEQTRIKARETSLSRLVNQAEDLYKKDSLGKALNVINKALKLDPNFPSAINIKKRIQTRSNKLYYTHFNKALEYYKDAEFKNAINSFNKSLNFALDKRKVNEARDYIRKSRYELTLLQEEKEDIPTVEFLEDEEAKERRVIDKEAVRRHYNKGLYYYKNGYLEKAIAEWEVVLNMDPEHERAYTSLQKAKAELKKRK